MVKEIILTKGLKSLVDDEDFDWLNRWKWHVTSSKNLYARRMVVKNRYITQILMHRLIMDCPKDKIVDHKDGNGLNNQRKNLRICTFKENSFNKTKFKKKNGFKGVYKRGKKFGAMICCNGERYNLGTYPTSEEAARAYDKAALKYHGEFAKLNFPNEIFLLNNFEFAKFKNKITREIREKIKYLYCIEKKNSTEIAKELQISKQSALRYIGRLCKNIRKKGRKITMSEQIEIKQMLDLYLNSGLGYLEIYSILAKKYNVSIPTIRRTINGYEYDS